MSIQHRTAARVAAALCRMDVGPGDRVVVLLPNCPEVLAAYTGILKTGAVIVPIVFLLSPTRSATSSRTPRRRW